jgi:hypothetical protein
MPKGSLGIAKLNILNILPDPQKEISLSSNEF